MNKKYLLVFILLLILPIVYAAPPFIEESSTATSSGLIIEYPAVYPLKQNTGHDFNFHIFNQTTGSPLTNATLECTFHLYNSSGNHIFIVNNSDIGYEYDTDFEVKVGKGNFSKVGRYALIFQCLNINHGGFIAIGFDVTSNGMEANDNNAGVTIAIAMILITITIIIFIFVHLLEGFDLKLVFSTLGYLMVVIDLYFAYAFMVIVDATRTGILGNILVIYEVALTGFKFMFPLVVIILIIRTILYFKTFNKKKQEKDEEWSL